MNKKKKIRSLNLSSEALSQNCFKKVLNVFRQKFQSKTCRFVVEMSHNLSTQLNVTSVVIDVAK